MKELRTVSLSMMICLGLLSGCASWDVGCRPTGAAYRSDARARMDLTGQPVSPAAAQAIRALLAGTTYAALRGDSNAIMSYFPDEDQIRLGYLADADRAEMARLARQYDVDVRSRYGRSFEWESANAYDRAFRSYQISREQDARRAYVIIPASHGLPEARLALVDLGNNTWRIDAPNTLTSAQLKGEVNSQLMSLSSTRSSWPGDSAESAAIAAHRMLSIFSAT